MLHETGGYFVLRFVDVDRLGKDTQVGPSGTSFPEALGVSSGPVFDLFKYSMITADGDVHRRRRAPFSRLFATRTINEMRQSIRRAADGLVGEWYERGEMDFFGEFASEMPARMIADLLGLPRQDIPEFTLLVYEVTKIFSFGLNPEELGKIENVCGMGWTESRLFIKIIRRSEAGAAKVGAASIIGSRRRSVDVSLKIGKNIMQPASAADAR